jgi:hypothetical protein
MRRQRTREEAGGLPRCLYSPRIREEVFSETHIQLRECLFVRTGERASFGIQKNCSSEVASCGIGWIFTRCRRTDAATRAAVRAPVALVCSALAALAAPPCLHPPKLSQGRRAALVATCVPPATPLLAILNPRQALLFEHDQR